MRIRIFDVHWNSFLFGCAELYPRKLLSLYKTLCLHVPVERHGFACDEIVR